MTADLEVQVFEAGAAGAGVAQQLPLLDLLTCIDHPAVDVQVEAVVAAALPAVRAPRAEMAKLNQRVRERRVRARDTDLAGGHR